MQVAAPGGDLAPALHATELRLAAMFESAMDGIVSVDAQQRVVMFNQAAERMFRCQASAALGQPLDQFIPARFRQHHHHHIETFGATGVTTRRMGKLSPISGLRADGEEFPIEASISQVNVDGQQLYTVILRDVTQRVQAETALRTYQSELSELAQRLMTQEKATTRNLAQALHDQLGQTLTAIRLSFDAAGVVAQAGGVAPSQQAGRISSLIDQAIREVRQVLVDLRPPLLDDSGLAAALDNELRTRRSAVDGIALRLEVAPTVAALRWPADVEYAAFMVAREAVANALQHAAPGEVRVVLDGAVHAMRLEVIDDGKQLAPDALRPRPGHLGLVGMRERALAIHARFAARPGGNGGTVVRLEWETAS